ncbi:MAG: ABC transporter permease [Anaerolineae bacterium]|nr:ABC transporter permease [Anaerolineae bacterium]
MSINKRFSPISLHELHKLMRSPRAFGVLTVFLCVVGGVALLMYAAAMLNETRRNASSIGQTLYFIISGMQLILVCFVAPALTATAISSERERGTYDILRASLITPWQIVRGKLTAPLGYTFLLILSTLPLLSLPLILGGIEIAEAVISVWVMLISGILFISIGLFVSTFCKTNLGAIILTYALVLILVIGIPIFALIASSFGAAVFTGTATLERLFTWLMMVLTSLSPISTLTITELNFYASGKLWEFSVPITGASPMTLLPPFVLLTLSYALLSLLTLGLSARRIGQPDKS